MENIQAVKIFDALSQETRLSVMLELVKTGHEGLCPCKLVEKFNVSNGALTFHLKELENAGLISSDKQGKFIFYKKNQKKQNLLKKSYSPLLRFSDSPIL
jgi:DNA-binding transcriptional ArsR family regulator